MPQGWEAAFVHYSTALSARLCQTSGGRKRPSLEEGGVPASQCVTCAKTWKRERSRLGMAGEAPARACSGGTEQGEWD